MALYHIFLVDRLYYCGEDLGTVQEFISSLKQGGSSTAQLLINDGLFEACLRMRGQDEDLLQQVRAATSTRFDDQSFAALQIYYLFSGQRRYVLNGRFLSGLEQLIEVVAEMSIEQVEDLAKDKLLLAWLSSLGYRDQLEAQLLL